MRKHGYAGQGESDCHGESRLAPALGPRGRGGSERAHVQSVARRKRILRATRNRNAMKMADDREPIGPRLVDAAFEKMRKKGDGGGDKKRVIARTARRSGLIPCRKPTNGGKREQDFLIGTPGQDFGQGLRRGPRMPGD